jgi:hypothetical protein
MKRTEICAALLESEKAPDYVKLVATQYRISLLIDQATEDKAAIDITIAQNEKLLASHVKNYERTMENETTTMMDVYRRKSKEGARARVKTEWPSFIKRLRENQRIQKKLEEQLTIARADSLAFETSIANMHDAKTKITPITIRSVDAINQLFADLNANFGTDPEKKLGEQEKIYVKNQETTTKNALSTLPEQESEDEAFKNDLIRMMLPALMQDGGQQSRHDEREDDDDIVEYAPQSSRNKKMSDMIYGPKVTNTRGSAVIHNEYEMR